jgi:hypothetical protein
LALMKIARSHGSAARSMAVGSAMSSGSMASVGSTSGVQPDASSSRHSCADCSAGRVTSTPGRGPSAMAGQQFRGALRDQLLGECKT